MCTGHLQLVFKVCNVFLGPFLSIIREPGLYQNQFLRGHALNTEYNFSEIFSYSSNTFLKMDFKVRIRARIYCFTIQKKQIFLVLATRLRCLCAEFCCHIFFLLSYLYFSHCLVDQLLWVHFAEKIGCIALLIQYLQITCS